MAIIATMFGLLVASLLLSQEPKPAAPARPAEAVSPSAPKRAVEAWDDKTAKAAVDRFGKEFKAASNLQEKTVALEGLAGGANAALVKPLVRIVETEKAVLVLKRAVELLGNQPPAAANPALRKLLKNTRVATSAPVLAATIRAICGCGYGKEQWAEIEPLFEQNFDPDFVPVHEAVLALVAQHKEAKAAPLLLRNLDEPAPVDVDAAHNPPAEYWKSRWTSWSAWRDKLKDTLFVLTGQKFANAAEAKAWLDKNPLK